MKNGVRFTYIYVICNRQEMAGVHIPRSECMNERIQKTSPIRRKILKIITRFTVQGPGVHSICFSEDNSFWLNIYFYKYWSIVIYMIEFAAFTHRGNASAVPVPSDYRRLSSSGWELCLVRTCRIRARTCRSVYLEHNHTLRFTSSCFNMIALKISNRIQSTWVYP
jgi:hypothetical protein